MAINEILITNKNKLTPRRINHHQPYEYDKFEIVSSALGNKCIVALFDIPPGKANYPYHYHLNNEEVFYIISGKGLLETPEGEVAVSKGDVIVFPPNKKGAHKLKNSSEDEMLTYLDVDTNNSPDVVFYPHTNKIGVFATNDHFVKLYKKDSNVDYYEGE